jgi:hypothetical protein
MGLCWQSARQASPPACSAKDGALLQSLAVGGGYSSRGSCLAIRCSPAISEPPGILGYNTGLFLNRSRMWAWLAGPAARPWTPAGHQTEAESSRFGRFRRAASWTPVRSWRCTAGRTARVLFRARSIGLKKKPLGMRCWSIWQGLAPANAEEEAYEANSLPTWGAACGRGQSGTMAVYVPSKLEIEPFGK